MKHQIPEDENHDPTWELLNQARKVEVDPFFARNVVREVRLSQEKNTFFSRLKSWFTQPSGILIASTAAIALCAAALLNLKSSEASLEIVTVTPEVETPISPELEITESLGSLETELEEIDHFGELLAVQDIAMLADEDIGRLLF